MRSSAHQLHKLAGQKDHGILTDAEFETEKAKILASLSAGGRRSAHCSQNDKRNVEENRRPP